MATLTDEHLRALRFLARHPSGCTEATLLKQGFTTGQLGHLVYAEFAKLRRGGGYRLQVRREGPLVRLFTRRGYDWTERYPAIAGTAGLLCAKSFTPDGEAVLSGEDGIDLPIPNCSTISVMVAVYIFSIPICEAVMAPNVFKQAGKMWRTIARLSGRARVSDRAAAAGSRAAKLRFGASAAGRNINPVGLGVRAAMFIGVAGPVHAQYVPAETTFTDLGSGSNGSSRVVCAIGYSKQGMFNGNNVPPYYLDSTGWKPTANLPAASPPNQQFLSAWQVGTAAGQISSIPTQPQVNNKYINAATIRFYVVDNPAGFLCSSIQWPWLGDFRQGIPDVPSTSKYPFALVELSIYPLDNANDTFLTINISNVDDFQVPVQVAIETKPNTPYARFGNPVRQQSISRQSIVTGTPSGGTNSPFYTWLATQPGLLPKTFQNLALASPSSYPYAIIESPHHYLQLKCTNPSANVYIPNTANCRTQSDVNQFVYLTDPLNSYYDSELATFFTNAVVGVNNSENLIVMGDAQGSVTAGPWTVNDYTMCPLFLKPSRSDKSLLFQFASPRVAPNIIICDPRTQVVPLQGDKVASYNQPAGIAKIILTSAQCKQAEAYFDQSTNTGWNFGQPSSGFTGRIKGLDCNTNTMTLSALKGPGKYSAATGINQLECNASDTGCPKANPTWSWVFTNIAWVGGTKQFESASDMVFANDGVFAGDFLSVMYSGAQQTIANSIGRNIVTAFNHGIANCNNVTMTRSNKPFYCSNVKALTTAQMNPQTAAAASDAYWSNEANWYPANGFNNYYAQYLHTYQLSTAGNIFLPPQPVISPAANSNQNALMGMAYGFGYDENPVYLQTPPSQVPSKLDPIPKDWFTNGLKYVNIIIGRSE
jgi:hypothetical protein